MNRAAVQLRAVSPFVPGMPQRQRQRRDAPQYAQITGSTPFSFAKKGLWHRQPSAASTCVTSIPASMAAPTAKGGLANGRVPLLMLPQS